MNDADALAPVALLEISHRAHKQVAEYYSGNVDCRALSAANWADPQSILLSASYDR